MRKTLLFVALSSLFVIASSQRGIAQVSFGVRIGPPPEPRAYAVPVQPGPGYEWVEGHWVPQGNHSHYRWHNGTWRRPPYAGAYWVAPYYWEGHYYHGYWDGDHGRRESSEHQDRH